MSAIDYTLKNPAAAPRRGNPTELECSTAGKSGGVRKLDENMMRAKWTEVQSLNRAAGPWGVARTEIGEKQ